jgi:hypothetical protein
MKAPKSEEEMYRIIEEWADLQECDGGDEVRYFVGEILSLIKCIGGK